MVASPNLVAKNTFFIERDDVFLATKRNNDFDSSLSLLISSYPSPKQSICERRSHFGIQNSDSLFNMTPFGRVFVTGWLLFRFISVLADQSNADDAYYNQFSVCADSIVVVEEMSMYCDSPGSYYYGSNKYRNSASCQAGDKAKLQIQFIITEDLSSDPFMSLNVQGYGTVEGISLYASESFCNSVSSGSNGETCPQAGEYYLKQQFYWGSQSDSYEYSFIPKIVVGITATAGSSTYELGGANTDSCYSGNTFSSWTTGIRKSAANTFATFAITFGILSGTLLAIAFFTYCMMRQAKRQHYRKENIIVDEEVDENDYHKIASLVGTEKGFVIN